MCAIGDLRRSRLLDPLPGIRVQGNLVVPTRSETVLGLYFDQDLSWRSYLWGEGWRPKDNFPGLIYVLMGRAAILQKLSRILPGTTMPYLVAGIFMSKLMYGIEVLGSVGGIPGQLGDYRSGIMKRDIQMLQSLHNKALCLIHN